jgi:hypothetical protein
LPEACNFSSDLGIVKWKTQFLLEVQEINMHSEEIAFLESRWNMHSVALKEECAEKK